MDSESIKDFLLTRKGQFSKAIWHRPCKTLKAFAHMSIVKCTTVVVRTGIDYENLTSTKEGRADGTLPSVNAGLLPGQSWEQFPYLINSEKSGLMVRVYPNCGQRIVSYYVNNILMSQEEIAPYVLASELRESSHIQNVPLAYFKELS